MANKTEVEVCTGSAMNGIDCLDLVTFAGLPPLTGDEHDMLWADTNEVDLLEECYWADFIWQEEDDIEHIPLYTDRYFTVYTTDVEKLKIELCELIKENLSAAS